ncbi:MAG: ubiquinone biosynthesis regulatory protein kinase UbiB [Gammaproteobacteria bacterium RIFCSPLOWO2_02_FULL_61_13]|nr:MAG: ubiquinone biosynthesis regulatory protein kinase UbiB [Gammaproteobacteria bacterium RIFCSPLOWO2_02_FULL_61_13]
MLTVGQLMRLLFIQRVLIRHGLDDLVFAMHLFRPLRFLLYLLPWNWFIRDRGPRAERLRRVLEDLGPIYVKLGQLLSTRRDMLPEDIAGELARLQDNVPPFPGAQAKQMVERALGRPVTELFLHFDETPLASASIAQVHAARSRDGRELIVKVVRPGIETVIRRDLGLMYILADMAERYWGDARRLKPSNVVREFEKTLLGELDLMREAANASQLRRNFAASDVLYVPQVDWELTRRDVMVMERISGLPVSDIDGLRRAGVDLKWLAEAGVELFFTQVFRDSFFHADMHPGNIFVRPEEGRQPHILVVDFGIMSSLTEYDQRYLAENFLAFLNRDYQKVAQLHVESGWVPAGTRVDEFEFAIRTVCEPLFDRPLKEISFGMLLLRLFQTARRFNMVILPQLILLQKTLVSIEGLGRQLYPDLDLWHVARPLLERWMSERVGWRGLLRGTRENLPHWLDRLPSLPNRVIDVVERLRDGRLQVEWRSPALEELHAELRRTGRRNLYSITGCTLFLAAVVLYGMFGTAEWPGGMPVLSWVLGGTGLGVLFLAWME